VKFLADMGISMKTVSWMRQQGHDIVHLREQNLQRLPDNKILEKARSEDRVLLTFDLDFGYLTAISRKHLPSLVIFRLEDERAESINQKLSAVLGQCSNDLETGCIVSVGESSFRIRHLPILHT